MQYAGGLNVRGEGDERSGISLRKIKKRGEIIIAAGLIERKRKEGKRESRVCIIVCVCLSLSLSAASNISFPVQLTDLLVGMCQHCLSSNIGLKNICLEVRSFRRAQKSPEETFPFKGIATSNFHHPPPDAAVVMLPGKMKRGKRKRKRKRRKKKKGKKKGKETLASVLVPVPRFTFWLGSTGRAAVVVGAGVDDRDRSCTVVCPMLAVFASSKPIRRRIWRRWR